METLEILGYIGIVLNGMSSIPQIIHTYTSKDVRGISPIFLYFWALGCSFLFVYAVFKSHLDYVSLVNYGVNVLFPSILIILYTKYHQKTKS